RLSTDMICTANEAGYFTRVNPAFERVLGYTTEELLRTPYMELIHPDDQEATAAEMARLAREHVPTVEFENRFRSKDGSPKWLAWTSTPFLGGLIYASARDVTERKRQEEELHRYAQDVEESRNRIEQQAAELADQAEEIHRAQLRAEAANKAKSEFLANMS